VRARRQEALAIADVHVGFNLNGKVTDVSEPRESMIEAMKAIMYATRAFRDEKTDIIIISPLFSYRSMD
jgi:hypothetical protein